MLINRGFFRVGRCFGFGYLSIWHILLIATVMVGIGILIYIAFSKNRHNKYKNDYLNQLKERYVLGEISEEEYLKKKHVLKNE